MNIDKFLENFSNYEICSLTDDEIRKCENIYHYNNIGDISDRSKYRKIEKVKKNLRKRI